MSFVVRNGSFFRLPGGLFTKRMIVLLQLNCVFEVGEFYHINILSCEYFIIVLVYFC